MKDKNALKNRLSSSWRNSWPGLMMLLIILIFWEAAVYIFDISFVVIPAPHIIVKETMKYFKSELLVHWLATVKIIAIGYISGVSFGILLASLISQSKLAIRALSPLITVLVTLPTMVIIPIYMVWVGFDIEYRAIPVFMNVASIITLNTLSGFVNVESRLLDLAESYGATRAQRFFKFVFPSALPEIFTGLRLGCTFSILNTIGIEFIAGKVGMGFAVQYFSGLLKMPIVWGCILIVGITGRVMFLIVEIFEKKLVTWTR
ncbi:ABC transporter permease [Anaeropeptidivorans aminofermentans]|jgi:ABC-type nitrate/sulfonate/bicarbonate transport system permease component|uniref:ABC transporter permease n=1 Tax=Anaeropeptidivorans aminofermentans TaxID=2934315 RepID=UPI0020241810|nr:ABC transporter permease [Anaeropeptidivorans aminofermentans]MBE6011500.1 ABC transporter permease [Lachnospiraceae bacterium]